MVQNGLAVDTPSPSSVTAQQEDNTLWVHTLSFQDMASPCLPDRVYGRWQMNTIRTSLVSVSLLHADKSRLHFARWAMRRRGRKVQTCCFHSSKASWNKAAPSGQHSREHGDSA